MNAAAADMLRRAADLLEQGDRLGALGLMAEVGKLLEPVPRWRGLEGLPADVAEAARSLGSAVIPVAVRVAYPDSLTAEQRQRIRPLLPPLLRRASSLGRAPDWRREARELERLGREAADGVPALSRLRRSAELLGTLADAEGKA